MNHQLQLDPADLLHAVAARIPAELHRNVVVVGSIATAWAFRDVLKAGGVATKDIDLLLRPSVDAVVTAESIGQLLLTHGWQPHYPNGIQPASPETPDNKLPALRLKPPADDGLWFVELLAEPPAHQYERKHWRRFETSSGVFGLPSFRYMRVAIHGAEATEWGLHVARPACMALAHLLEHADPDRTPISSLADGPPRFVKDVGRAVSLWWLAREQSPSAASVWFEQWRGTLDALFPGESVGLSGAARAGLTNLADYLPEAHEIAVRGVLESSRTSLDAYRRAYATLQDLLGRL